MKKIIMVIMLMVVCLGTAEVKALILNDGGVHTIDYQLDDHVWVEDSPSDEFTTLNLVDGGTIRDWVVAIEYSHINITGGSIGYDLYAEHYSQVIMSGGSIAYDLNAIYESQVSVYGGIIGDEILTRDYSQITIYGSDFAVDGIPVDYGLITTGTLDEFGTLSGTLTGILDNGDLIDNTFYIEDDAHIFLVPEPTTMVSLSLGLFFLNKKKRI